MLAKFIKSAIVLAVALTLFGGTAMADNRGHGGHHHHQWHHQSQHYHHARPDFGHRGHVYVVPAPRPQHRPHHYQTSSLHPLAPRIVFLGPLPIPVPPPPNEVLDYITGR
jgi:hypothetical protein